MEIKERIQQSAGALFMNYGVRSVTLDEIANELGISKKTIYQYFLNKAEIILEVARTYIKEEQLQIEQIASNSENAVHELVNICAWSTQTFQNMAPKLVYEVQKYYPQAWKVFEEYSLGYILDKLKDNLNRGIQEKLYRPDMNVEMVARIRISQFDASTRQDYFPLNDFDPATLQLEMFELFMYGIVTQQGRIILKEYLNQENYLKTQTVESNLNT